MLTVPHVQFLRLPTSQFTLCSCSSHWYTVPRVSSYANLTDNKSQQLLMDSAQRLDFRCCRRFVLASRVFERIDGRQSSDIRRYSDAD